MIFLCYSRCSTCKKAENWLKANNIEYDFRDIKENNPSADEIKNWNEKSGLPLKKFFNTSGRIYKEMNLKDKLPHMNEDEQLSLLASDGLLVKRPVLACDDFVLVGFKEADWAKALK